jgi:hypothetical protein
MIWITINGVKVKMIVPLFIRRNRNLECNERQTQNMNIEQIFTVEHFLVSIRWYTLLCQNMYTVSNLCKSLTGTRTCRRFEDLDRIRLGPFRSIYRAFQNVGEPATHILTKMPRCGTSYSSCLMRVHPPVKAQKCNFRNEYAPGYVTSPALKWVILKYKEMVIINHRANSTECEPKKWRIDWTTHIKHR